MGIARNIARLIPNGSGLLPNANIEAVAASKLTGTVSDSQIAGLTASKLSGVIPDANAPSGSVIQVVQVVKTNSFSYSGSSFVDIPGFNASITPTSTNSKILINVCVSTGEGGDAFPAFYLQRDGTTLLIGDAAGPGTRTTFSHVNTGADARDTYLIAPVHFKYLDSPATTSSINYKVQVSPMRTTTRVVMINRSETIGDANQVTATSTLILMEIAG